MSDGTRSVLIRSESGGTGWTGKLVMLLVRRMFRLTNAYRPLQSPPRPLQWLPRLLQLLPRPLQSSLRPPQPPLRLPGPQWYRIGTSGPVGERVLQRAELASGSEKGPVRMVLAPGAIWSWVHALIIGQQAVVLQDRVNTWFIVMIYNFLDAHCKLVLTLGQDCTTRSITPTRWSTMKESTASSPRTVKAGSTKSWMEPEFKWELNVPDRTNMMPGTTFTPGRAVIVNSYAKRTTVKLTALKPEVIRLPVRTRFRFKCTLTTVTAARSSRTVCFTINALRTGSNRGWIWLIKRWRIQQLCKFRLILALQGHPLSDPSRVCYFFHCRLDTLISTSKLSKMSYTYHDECVRHWCNRVPFTLRFFNDTASVAPKTAPKFPRYSYRHHTITIQ